MRNFFLNRDPRLLVVRKTADETISNDTVLQDDGQLKFTVPANSVYYFIQLVKFISTAVADIKMNWSLPAAASIEYQTQASGTTYTTAGNLVLSGTGGNIVRTLNGIVIIGATAGEVQYRWAQQTAEVSDTKVLKDSCLLAFRIR